VLLGDLLRFYVNPQKFFINDSLGIRLDTGEDLPDDREMFEVSGLDKYYIEEEMVRSGFAGTMGDFCKKVQIEGQWPLGMSGLLAFEKQKEGVEEFIVKVHEQQMGARLLDVPMDFAAGRYRLFGTLSNLYENGVMLVRYGKLRGRDLLAGWIHHLVLRRLVPTSKTRIVAMDAVIGFSDAAEGPDLETLLSLFDEGVRTPSSFYIEPALDYARQLANTRSRTLPIDRAFQTLNLRLQNGYEPEWELLFSGSGEEIEFGAEFERLCHEIMCPIWSAADE